jgi:arabinogalactan endo-1,4-beta-galactosidase
MLLPVLLPMLGAATTTRTAWTNVTLFQIVPASFLGQPPADMWHADAFLAAYYDLRGRYGPMACHDPGAAGSEFCSEYQEIAPRANFVVRKLVVEANLASQPTNGGWGNYSTCGLSLDRASFSCFCGAGCDCGCDCGEGCGCGCDGLANTIGRCPSHGFGTAGSSPPYGDWHSLFAQKGVGQHWYNTLRSGHCDGEATAAGGTQPQPRALAPTCTWRVAEYAKSTNLSCHADKVDSAMEARPDMAACLSERCGPNHTRGSNCWAECYMEILLGPNATTPHTGMTATEITALWLAPFTQEADGGCPDINHHHDKKGVPAPAEAPFSGVDLSQLGTEDNNGASPPFKASPSSPPTDALALLRQHGANTFRMRMWNDPCADGRCDPKQWSYANLSGVKLMARRCSAHNLTFVLDLHYSDWWADPGKQWKPQAWKALAFSDLVDAVHDFTQASVAALVAQGTPPYAVQVGNEISNGMLWNNASNWSPGPGEEPCSQGGRLFCGNTDKDKADSWRRFSQLVAAGIKGARTACPATKIAIHTDLGNHIIKDKVSYLIDWYKSLAAGIGEETFDLIGLSTYPQWDGGSTLQSVAQMNALARAFPDVKVYIAETAYPAAGGKQPEAAFPATPAGQLSFLKAIRAAAATALGAQNGGVLWWEGKEDGAWNSLFTDQWVARPALLKGFA